MGKNVNERAGDVFVWSMIWGRGEKNNKTRASAGGLVIRESRSFPAWLCLFRKEMKSNA